MFWTFVIAQALISAVFCGVIADSKNRDVIGWVVLGFFFGLFALIAAVGVAPLTEMQPQAGTPLKEAPPPPANAFTGERDLSNDAYKLWLAAHYGIARNEVFNSFIVEERIFPDLEEALAYAHSQEMAVIAAAEAAAIAKATAEENERKLREQQMAEYAAQEDERRRNFWRREVWIIAAISIFSIAGLLALLKQEMDRFEISKKEEEKRKVDNQIHITENLKVFDLPLYGDADQYEFVENAESECSRTNGINGDFKYIKQINFNSTVVSGGIDSAYNDAAINAGFEKLPSFIGWTYSHADGRIFNITTQIDGTIAKASICLAEKGVDRKN